MVISDQLGESLPRLASRALLRSNSTWNDLTWPRLRAAKSTIPSVGSVAYGGVRGSHQIGAIVAAHPRSFLTYDLLDCWAMKHLRYLTPCAGARRGRMLLSTDAQAGPTRAVRLRSPALRSCVGRRPRGGRLNNFHIIAEDPNNGIIEAGRLALQPEGRPIVELRGCSSIT
jgi:hypothetical protein